MEGMRMHCNIVLWNPENGEVTPPLCICNGQLNMLRRVLLAGGWEIARIYR